MRYLWRRFLIWWRGIKVTGEGMISSDVTLNTINPEPSKYGYKWAAHYAVERSKPKPKKRRQRDIDAEKLEMIKAKRVGVLNDLIPEDGLRSDDTPHFASINLKTGEVTKG